MSHLIGYWINDLRQDHLGCKERAIFGRTLCGEHSILESDYAALTMGIYAVGRPLVIAEAADGIS